MDYKLEPNTNGDYEYFRYQNLTMEADILWEAGRKEEANKLYDEALSLYHKFKDLSELEVGIDY